VNKKLYQLIDIIKIYMGLFLSISLGVFLFVLFFQPFPLDRFDFDNKLLFVAGLGTIVFLFMIFRIILSWRTQINRPENTELEFPSYPGDFLLMVLNSVAFAFYLRYVGAIDITFYIMFKVVLISLAPPVVLRLSESFRELRYRNESLIKHQMDLLKQIEKQEENLLSKSIEFISENRNENLKLPIADIVFMRSADNYVEITHREGEAFKKDLIRSTLKNVEQQIKPYINFVRCHRTCIVNSHYINKLHNTFNNHWLSLRDSDEKIPVSRQYLLIIREVL
jgi:DNA-binding LytR/AlgR family response regulator